MDPCNFWNNHDQGQGHHFNPVEEWLLVYDIKLPSTQALKAQDFLMKTMLELKDGTRDNLPPGIPRAFINFEMLNLPETTPLDDLRKCQFAINLKKEVCSPISTLRVIIRIPARA